MSKIESVLNNIQQELKAPKGQTNNFGNYKYRSCEDILEAVKPLLGSAVLTISDDIVEVGDRVYVKATATLKHDGGDISVNGFAREALTKKGMDDSQITGAASSYARKYALNGLFCIDDTKDADTNEAKQSNIDYTDALEGASSLADLSTEWNKIPADLKPSYIHIKDIRKEELS